MPLTGTANIIGLLLAAAAGSLDDAGLAAWGATGGGIAGVLASWLPGKAVVSPLGVDPLIATASVITGKGSFEFLDEDTLGPLLAAAAGSTDAAGITAWTAIGVALLQWWKDHGEVVPDSLVGVGPPTGGPITGTGTLSFSSLDVGPSLAAAAGTVDQPGIDAWTTLGHDLLNNIQNAASILPGVAPLGLASPASGPLTGVGTVF